MYKFARVTISKHELILPLKILLYPKFLHIITLQKRLKFRILIHDKSETKGLIVIHHKNMSKLPVPQFMQLFRGQ